MQRPSEHSQDLRRIDSGSLVPTSVNRHKVVTVNYQEPGKQELPHNYHCFNLSFHVFTSKQMAASVQSILFTAAEVSKQQNQIKSSDAIQNTHNPMVRRTN